MTDKTIKFNIRDEHENEMRRTIQVVYDALKEKGYNPFIKLDFNFGVSLGRIVDSLQDF